MKAISSAIIALSGAVTVAGGVSTPTDVGSLAMFVGYGLLLVGVLAWAVTISDGGNKK